MSSFNTALLVIILVVIAGVGGAWWYKNYGIEKDTDTAGFELNIGTQEE